jgi:hypothetical protein
VVDRIRNTVRFFAAAELPSRLVISVIAVLLLGITSAALGQPPEDDVDHAPPPLKILNADEKSRLRAETEVKRRTKLGLELMDARLKRAETFDTAENYDEMFFELGAFHGLMDDMLGFLNKSDRDSDKVLNNFKRFEIGLRGFITRLEMIRHDLPLRYELYVRNLARNLRAARARAIEPLFDDTVVPDKKPGHL